VMAEPPLPERGDHLVEVGTGRRHLEVADARAHREDEHESPVPGRSRVHLSLRDHGVQGLVDPPAGVHDRGAAVDAVSLADGIRIAAPVTLRVHGKGAQPVVSECHGARHAVAQEGPAAIMAGGSFTPLRTRSLDHARGRPYRGPGRLPGPDLPWLAISSCARSTHVIWISSFCHGARADGHTPRREVHRQDPGRAVCPSLANLR
jgi:hypothetical protein